MRVRASPLPPAFRERRTVLARMSRMHAKYAVFVRGKDHPTTGTDSRRAAPEGFGAYENLWQLVLLLTPLIFAETPSHHPCFQHDMFNNYNGEDDLRNDS